MKKILVILTLIFITAPAFANLSNKLGYLMGYTIAGKKTIAGWYDKNGKSGDSFEGCEFDRVIVFDDNKILTCVTYGYQYEYRPTAIILFNGSSFKMIVGDDIYDMSRF